MIESHDVLATHFQVRVENFKIGINLSNLKTSQHCHKIFTKLNRGPKTIKIA